MPATLPAHPHCCTHACSPSPGAPSSQGHTRDTGVLRSPAGSDTGRSEGGTQSPWQLVHRHKGGSPGTAQSRSVLPMIHLIVTAQPSTAVYQPWKHGLSQAPQGQPNLPLTHSCTDQDSPSVSSSAGLLPPIFRPYFQPYQTAVTALSSHACLAQAAPTLRVTGFCPTWGAVTPCREWGL